jgi:ribonuclease G
MTVAYEIFRDIRRLGSSSEQQRIIVGAHPSVARLLQEEEQQGLEDLERRYAAKIIVMPDSKLHLEQYDLVMM